MKVNGREITLYKFGNDKSYGYFDINGKSVEKALMKTPINGARLSSPFGMRKHPIQGFNKMHNLELILLHRWEHLSWLQEVEQLLELNGVVVVEIV